MKLAVIGDPVAHSLSPALHRSFLDAAGIAGEYHALLVPAGEGAGAIAHLRTQGYRGLNVTTPLKEEAFAACDRCDELALASGAVNTIVYETSQTVGYNTDGMGALSAIAGALERPDIDGVRILVLGAGPTARASVAALIEGGASVRVWNRTEERARTIVATSDARLWRPGEALDVVFSTLAPLADLPEHVQSACRDAGLLVDANYGPRATLGSALGREAIDGYGMLRAGARASFARFTG
jgi:shikimate dehydrogenase